VGVGEMEVVVFCLSSISPLADCLSFLEGVESLRFCGECFALIREVNRLHDLLTQMTDALERNVLQMKRKVDDLVSTQQTARKEGDMEEELGVSIKEEVSDLHPELLIRSVTVLLNPYTCKRGY